MRSLGGLIHLKEDIANLAARNGHLDILGWMTSLGPLISPDKVDANITARVDNLVFLGGR